MMKKRPFFYATILTILSFCFVLPKVDAEQKKVAIGSISANSQNKSNITTPSVAIAPDSIPKTINFNKVENKINSVNIINNSSSTASTQAKTSSTAFSFKSNISQDQQVSSSSLSMTTLSSPIGEDIFNNQPLGHSGLFVNVSPQFGSLIQSFPIKVPAGINGIEPNIVISYSSNMRNGLLGVGWVMELGAIECSTKRGAPQYDGSDSFVLVQQGSAADLVYDSTNQIYHPKIEGSFSKIEHKTSPEDYWLITDKSGTQYYYGQTQASRLDDPTDSSHIFKWCLDKVEDVHGNYMEISYYKDSEDNQIYPDTIDYAGNQTASLAPYAQVIFERETRLKSYSAYNPGFLVKTTQRINKVTVKAEEQIQREYVLGYSASVGTGRDLVSTITEFDASGQSLPPITFSYYDNKGFTGKDLSSDFSSIAFSMYIDGPEGFRDLGVRFVDVNSDGYPDIIKHYVNALDQKTSITYLAVADGDNISWSAEDTNWYMPTFSGTGIYTYYGSLIQEELMGDTFSSDSIVGADTGVRLSDLNGDGRIDFIWAEHMSEHLYDFDTGEYLGTGYGVANWVAVNNGQGWTEEEPSSWELPAEEGFFSVVNVILSRIVNNVMINIKYYGQLQHLGNEFIDVNGDGYTDFISSYQPPLPSDTTGTLRRSCNVYLNNMVNGTEGWTLSSPWSLPDFSYADLKNGASLVDLNGDYLPDIFYLVQGSTSHVFMNTGNGWIDDTQSPWLDTSGYGDLTDKSTQFTDINGDSLPDMIIAKGSPAAGNKVLINTGDGWMPDDSWTFPEGSFTNLATRLVDYNADLMTDYIINLSGETARLYTNDGEPTDLLKAIDNSVGGVSTFYYASSAKFDHDDGFLPFNIPVVERVVRTNSLEDSYETSYSYSNGYWAATDPVEDREFRGFADIKIVNPDQHYSISHYLVADEIFKGKKYEQTNYNSQDELLSSTYYWWYATPVIEDSSDFVFLGIKADKVFDENLNHKASVETYSYDENQSEQYGNLTTLHQFGNVEFIDESNFTYDTDITRVVRTDYTNNFSDWVIGLPYQISIRDLDEESQEQEIRLTKFYYDYSDVLGDTPTLGLLTKKEEDAKTGNSEDNPKTQMFYNDLGLLRETIDPRGKETNITFDSEYGMFPVVVENHLGHTVVSEYYEVAGIETETGLFGLWGQLKSSVDQNNNTTQYGYDGFGRQTKVVSPLDTVSLPTQEILYDYGDTYSKVTTRQRVKSGEASIIDTYVYSDGLGRHRQTKVLAPNGQYIVSGQTRYNSHDLPVEQYLPYYSQQSNPDYIESFSHDNPYVAFAYDGIDRLVQTTNPDASTYTTTQYNLWTVEYTDENGHRQDSTYDGWGRLLEKVEKTGSDNRFPALYPGTGDYSNYTTTYYKYDVEGNLLETKDQDDVTTIITYDYLGRKKQMSDPDMGTWFYDYDLNGNLVYQKDAMNHEISFEYDDINRLKRKWDSSLSVNVLYHYDDLSKSNSIGRLTSVEYPGGSKSFAYDSLGRETASGILIDGYYYEIKKEYNALNNIISIEYPDEKKVYYKYNVNGQIEGVSNNPGQQSSIVPKERGKQWAFLNKIKQGFVVAGKAVIEEIAGLFTVKAAYADTITPIDYTTFTEQDVDNKITVTSSCITFSDIETRNTSSFVYRSDSITGDFTYEFDTILTDSDTFSGETAVWGISNTGGDTYDDWSDGAIISWYKSGTTIRLEVENISNHFTRNSTGLDMNQRYYIRVNRQDSTLYVDIYSDADRTVLVDSLERSFDDSSYAYLYGFSIDNNNNSNYRASGDVCNLGVETGQADTEAPTAPTNASFGNETSSSLTLSWDASTDNVGVTGYRIDVATDSSFTNMVSGYDDLDVGDVLTKDVTGLDPDTTYYGRVRAYDAAENTSSNSNTATGATTSSSDTEAPTAPTNASFGNETSSGLTLSWDASTDNVGVTGYRIDVATDSSFTNMVSGYDDLDVGDVLTKDVTGLDPDTTYYGRVRAYDAAENTSSNSNTATGQTLSGGSTGMNPIDYTTFTEVDPTSQVSVTSDCVSFTDIETRNNVTYLYKSQLTEGDFVYEFDTILTSSDTFSGETTIWGITNTESDTYDDWDDGAQVVWYKSGSIIRIELEKIYPYSGDNSVTLNMDQRYYLRVSRTEETITAEIYSDSARTQLVDTLSKDVGTDSYSYLYAFSTEDSTLTNKQASGDVCNLAVEGEQTDTEAPTIPANVNFDNETDSSLTLNWDASTDNVGVTGYRIDVATDNNFSNMVTGYADLDVGNVLIKDVTGLDPDTTYYGRVRAYDAASNISTNSDTATGTTLSIPEEDYISYVDYYPSGQIKEIQYANGVVTQYTYDDNLRLQQIVATDAGSNELQNFIYTYDGAGNMWQIEDYANSSGTQVFNYDDLNRLVTAEGNYGAGQVYEVKNYMYSPNGNIQEKDSQTYTYSQVNAGPHAVTSIGSDTFNYDDNGNMISQTVSGVITDYDYDMENRLIEISQGTTTIAEHGYDEGGARVKKAAGGNTTRFVGALYEDVSSGLTNNYIYLGGIRVAVLSNSTVKYYHADHLGSANVITDENGSIIDVAEYKPFGEFSRHDSVNDEGYYFTDQYNDEETALYYYGARYYNPRIGRFISPDLVVPNPGNSQTLNRYSYVYNNPASYVDPSGNWTLKGTIVNFFNNIKNITSSLFKDPIGTLVGPLYEFGSFISSTIIDSKLDPQGLSDRWGTNVENFAAKAQTSEGQDEIAADVLTFITTVAILHKVDSTKFANILKNEKGFVGLQEERLQFIYRSGGKNPGSLKLRPGESGVSFFESLANPISRKNSPIFRSGKEFIVVDVGKLPKGSVFKDNLLPGHVQVQGVSHNDIIQAIVPNNSLGLPKRLP